MESDEDTPQLSAEAHAALLEFYNEQLQKTQDEVKVENGKAEVEEDWQLSQFWYNSETICKLVEGILEVTNYSGRIALISCPSLYKKFKETSGNHMVTVFEYDKRFAVTIGEDYVYYDYKHPLNIPQEMVNSFDVVVADPPYLSDECLTKTAITIKRLAKDKIILCTGAVMEELAARLLNLKKCKFQPGHNKNLANEFNCYCNFNFDDSINKSKFC